jgi:hypothetical protein
MLQRLSFRLLVTALLSCASAYPDNPAQRASENDVKAAFVYNFVKFVEWPGTVAEQRGPVVMCVMGKDPFGDSLRRAVDGRKVNGRPIAVRQINDVRAVVSCHVLFVSASESAHTPEIVRAVLAWSILTVGEGEQFIERGGMVAFLMKGDRVQFQINAKAASEAGLKISSKLLLLAAPGPGNKGKN